MLRFEQENKKNLTLFTIDLIRSKKNAIYHSQYDFPLFTVMDEPQTHTDDMAYTKVGSYFMDSELYVPTKGNGT